jgi:pimeloyl-ACP methyl ester carboxylesterase
MLLNRGLAASCIAIHAAPPKGVFPYEFNFLRSTTKALGLFTSLDKTYMMSFKKFRFAFVNGMSRDEQKKAYDALAIPESKRVARGGLTKVAYVDFKKEHAPLLLLAGSKDQIIPAHLCRRVYKKYKTPNSVTEYVVKDRNHFVLGLPTWKEDADFILEWISRQQAQLASR